ncbi:(2Fe-2S)-binding protein [Geothrix campi]|jgi:bacterioferritin-associated ferredoxin|uniref:(2Fe-2S)-binding protein n=1 Tax=Geothrix campi TaxID=2966450 RepID=UPI002147FC7F|nr:(2Fe-2S)-binding protein [Geothrix sp. SG10]
MFLCVCNAITEDQVVWAVRERGAESVAAVFEALAAKPDCGRCLGAMAEAVLAIRAGEPVRVAQDPLATPWGCRGRCRPTWGEAAGIAKAS